MFSHYHIHPLHEGRVARESMDPQTLLQFPSDVFVQAHHPHRIKHCQLQKEGTIARSLLECIHWKREGRKRFEGQDG